MYFVYFIGCKWKASSTAGVNLKMSEMTLLCAGSMGVGLWGTKINMSLDVNGKIRAGGFKQGQYTCLHS